MGGKVVAGLLCGQGCCAGRVVVGLLCACAGVFNTTPLGLVRIIL